MICAFAIKGKDIGMDDPIAWVMFIFYSVAIITMLGKKELSCPSTMLSFFQPAL